MFLVRTHGLALAAASVLVLAACSSSTNSPVDRPDGAGGQSAIGDSGTPGAAGAAGAAGSVSTPPVDAKNSLYARYQEYFPIGVALENGHIQESKAIVDQYFNHLTAENSWKFGEIHPQENTWNFTSADALADYARARGIKMTGHAMVWHNQIPAWLFADLTPGDSASIEKLKSRMKTHIDTMVERYSDVVDNWDVVNEAISDDGSKTYRDDSKWYQIFGSEEYIYWAFRYTKDALEAKEAGSSKGKLYYNDYNITLKTEAIASMLNWLEKDKQLKIDGVGFQSHHRIDWPSTMDLNSAFNKFVSMGYMLKVSELDISLYNDYPAGTYDPAPEVEFTPELEQLQAERYAALFALFRKYSSNISSVSVWGISDDRTWLDSFPLVRNNYPLLFNDAHQPKKAVDAIMNF